MRFQETLHPSVAGTTRGLLLLMPVFLAACSHPVSGTRSASRQYGAMVGRTEVELVKALGLPAQREDVNGHEFLTYEQVDVWNRGAPSARSADGGRHVGTVAFECRATFVVVAGVVSSYSLSGNDC